MYGKGIHMSVLCDEEEKKARVFMRKEGMAEVCVQARKESRGAECLCEEDKVKCVHEEELGGKTRISPASFTPPMFLRFKEGGMLGEGVEFERVKKSERRKGEHASLLFLSLVQDFFGHFKEGRILGKRKTVSLNGAKTEGEVER